MNAFGIILYFLIPSFLAKSIFTLLLILANLYFKETRGVMITMAPITLWVLLFSSAKDIPMSWRRPIDVNTLYDLETKLGSACFKFNGYHNVFLDLLAWLPYGIIHYIMPVLVGLYLIFFYKPGYTSPYLFFFGVMNVVGVITQLIWPTAPPWYYMKNKTNPATYQMFGDPAGLQRIDDLFHIDFYYTTFTGNPLPWGAWPSLHSGFASYSAIFLSYLYPKYTPIFFLYVAWIWWATMYLGHHYLVDVLGGFVYALVCAICSIIYIQIKKPYHKDYTELKTIMVQEYDHNLLANELSASYRSQLQKSFEPIIDTERKITGTSTVVNESIAANDATSSNGNEYGNNGNSPMTVVQNEVHLTIPNDPNLDKLSVISNVEKDTNSAVGDGINMDEKNL